MKTFLKTIHEMSWAGAVIYIFGKIEGDPALQKTGLVLLFFFGTIKLLIISFYYLDWRFSKKIKI